MKQRLTNKQLAVFCYLQEFFRENDQLPPTQFIADRVGAKNRSSGTTLCQALASKGYLERNEAGGYRFAREATNA